MALIQRGDIKTRALRRTDYENSDFPDTDEMNQWVNDGYYQFYDLLVSTLQDHYIADPVTVTLTSGQSEIDLDTDVTDFYQLRGLDYLRDGDKYRNVKSFNFRDRNRYRDGVEDLWSDRLNDRRYRLLNKKIKIMPPERGPGTYRIWYVPVPTALTDDTDTFEDENGWSTYVVAYVARNLLQKAQEDYSHIEREMAEMTQRVQALSIGKDTNKIETVVDVTSSGFEYGNYNWFEY